jgi:3-hydroxymyristoyl/3-hydroxydecanoyl-(acyl carrier protein) dehydratase
MRYVLIDRITSLERGRALRAVKNVSVSDDLVTRYGPGFSALPATMVLEAMAQAAGLLVAATIDARAQPVLAKVQPFTAYGDAVPGDQVWLDAALEELRDEGCRARVRATVGDRAIADATIYLALVPLDADGALHRAGQLRACLADTFPGWFNTVAVAEIES